MTHRRIESFLKKHVLPHLDGWECRGKLLFKAPIGFNFLGFELDPSHWDKELIANIYLHFKATGMEDERKLGITPSIHLLPKREGVVQWDLGEGDEESFASDFLSQLFDLVPPIGALISTPRTVVETYSEFEKQKLPNTGEFKAVNHVILGDLTEAASLYEKKIAAVEDMNTEGWYTPHIERLRAVHGAIGKSWEQAVEQLHEYEREFAEKHRLTQWVDDEKWNDLRARS